MSVATVAAGISGFLGLAGFIVYAVMQILGKGQSGHLNAEEMKVLLEPASAETLKSMSPSERKIHLHGLNSIKVRVLRARDRSSRRVLQLSFALITLAAGASLLAAVTQKENPADPARSPSATVPLPSVIADTQTFTTTDTVRRRSNYPNDSEDTHITNNVPSGWQLVKGSVRLNKIREIDGGGGPTDCSMFPNTVPYPFTENTHDFSFTIRARNQSNGGAAGRCYVTVSFRAWRMAEAQPRN